MEQSVCQRINVYLKHKRISIYAFCKDMGLKQTTVNKQLNGTAMLSIETILPIVNAFPDLSAEWLLRGVGTMEHPEPDAELKAMYIEQGREIHRLKQRIAELEGEKKDRA